jgi:hypothetical protein
MSREPGWARDDDSPSLVQVVERAAQEKLTEEIAAEKLHTRVTGALPIDRERARAELTEEQRALRSSRPKTRRWKTLAKIDDEIDDLGRRQAEAIQSVAAADEAVSRAPEHDANTLAEWLAGGERGPRPEATLPERERELAASKLLVDAITVELDNMLVRRLEYVEKNRKRMAEDAGKDRERAGERLQAAISELAEVRMAATDAASLQLWVAHYPRPEANSGDLHMGLMKGGRLSKAVPDITSLTSAASVLEWLRDDARWLAGAVEDQRRKQDEPDDPHFAPVWEDSPEGREAVARANERIRQGLVPRHTREAGWGD